MNKLAILVAFIIALSSIAHDTKLTQASGTIYIRADGSINPPTAPIIQIGSYYALTGDIESSGDGVIIQKGNITIDGAGHTLEGSGIDSGFRLLDIRHVKIKNVKIKDFYYGIWLSSCSNSIVDQCNITCNGYGVCLDSSSNNSISGNNIESSGYGVFLYWGSGYNSVSVNNIVASGGLGVGIYVEWYSYYNSIAENNITAGGSYGIYVGYCGYNNIIKNNIEASGLYTVFLDSSVYNNISGNNVRAGSGHGVYLDYNANYNGINRNTIKADNGNGVYLDSQSNYNSVSGNNVEESACGVHLYECSNNFIYHNNFLRNTIQAYVYPLTAYIWDDGYPSGGNFWSDYNGADNNSDGLGDIAYAIDAVNRDRYPLMKPYPWGGHDIGITTIKTSKTNAWQTIVPISVSVFNYGNHTETINITICVNATVIGVEEVTLARRDSANVSFVWNATSFAKGNYNISVNVTVVPGETDISDNLRTDGWILITISGDVDGDKAVNVLDLILIANHLAHMNGDNHTPYSPDWYDCMNTDINNDGAHNVLDLILCANHLGENW